MKIALLNDFKDYAGAEVSIKQRLKAKPGNIQVDLKTPGDPIAFEQYDAFILENIVMFKPEVLKNIIMDRPYIKMEHDFNYCVYRNQIHCKTCDVACPVQTNPMMKILYENAKLVIAASPAHMKFQMQQLAGWNVNYDYGLPWVLKDVKIPKVDRVPKTVAYLGTLRAYKGIYDIMELATRKPDYHFDLAGRVGYVKGVLPANVSYVGAVDDKWKYLASHEYFIHLPRHLDPCPGTALEAIVMGCKLIVNGNVGTLSYPFKTRDEWVNALTESGKIFWKKITTTFNK